MQHFPEIFNAVEAFVWLAIGMELLRRGVGVPGRPRIQLLIAAGTFVLFGGSDVVEITSGAWWRPWWLLLWKAACVVILAAIYLDYLRHRRSDRSRSD